jgi:hypothetical protein
LKLKQNPVLVLPIILTQKRMCIIVGITLVLHTEHASVRALLVICLDLPHFPSSLSELVCDVPSLLHTLNSVGNRIHTHIHGYTHTYTDTHARKAQTN